MRETTTQRDIEAIERMYAATDEDAWVEAAHAAHGLGLLAWSEELRLALIELRRAAIDSWAVPVLHWLNRRLGDG